MPEQAKGKDVQGTNLPAKQVDQSVVKKLPPKGEIIEMKPIKENAPLTVEETIRRVNELQDNIDLRELLKRHLEAVSLLKFGEYNEKDVIVLVSHTGEKYEIKSSSLCQESAELIKRRISEHIEQVEQQIVL